MNELSKKILVADDDSEDLMMLTDALQSADANLEIVTVTNGQEVLRYLAECSVQDLPAVVILDYKMPFFNAAEVLEKIQRQEIYRAMLKMVWSTSQQKEHMDRCLRAGARNYFIKPAEMAELNKIAKAILQESGE